MRSVSRRTSLENDKDEGKENRGRRNRLEEQVKTKRGKETNTLIKISARIQSPLATYPAKRSGNELQIPSPWHVL